MRKLLMGFVAALSMVTLQTAQAQENTYETGSSNFYAGLYGGYGATDADNSNGPDPEPSGIEYGIYGGYKIDSIMKEWDIALTGAVEIYYGGSNADETTGGVRLEKGREYGIRLLPGISFLDDRFWDLSPYGILGYRVTEYEANDGVLSFDEDYNGFELGIGTEFLTVEDLSFRVDYTHVFYAEDNGIDPSEDNLRFGVTYNF